MAKDIQEKNEKDLQKELAEKQEALRAFRFGISGSKVRNVREGRALRRDVARILTEVSRRTK
jgi:ribosomal protein L29